MKPESLQDAFAPVPDDFHQALVSATQRVEESARPRARGWVMVLAMVLVLAVGTVAVALVNRFSVKDYQADGNPTEEFLAHVIDIQQTHENAYMTATITDAVTDGKSLALAMHMESKDPGKPVFLAPTLTATSGGQPLGVTLKGMQGDFDSGFLFPGSDGIDTQDGAYGLTAAITEDIPGDEIEWTFTMQVYTPNWPIRVAENGDITPQEAIARQEILLIEDDFFYEYIDALTPPDDMDREAWYALSYGEKLALCGALTLVDTFETVQHTDLDGVRIGIGRGLWFPFDDFTVEFGGIDLSFMQMAYKFDLVLPEGADFDEASRISQHYMYNLETEDGEPFGENEWAMSGVSTREDGRVAIRHEGQGKTPKALPDAVVFAASVVDYVEHDGEYETIHMKKEPACSFRIPLN